MPELKPCPACGDDANIITIEDDKNPCIYFSGWCLCGMRGPEETSEAAAIAAWNSLPRRPDYNDVDCAGCPERRRGYLTWTTEPPTVAGWYWQRLIGRENTCTMAWITLENKKLRCKSIFGDRQLTRFKGFEWAGPIPIPEEHVS